MLGGRLRLVGRLGVPFVGDFWVSRSLLLVGDLLTWDELLTFGRFVCPESGG